jgi:hypothetical protein
VSSSGDDWYQKYQQQQEADHKHSQRLVEYVLPALRFLGVLRVEIKYDGYGDEGELTETVFAPMPATGLPEGLHRVIEHACELALPGGWEINEGSFGMWEIDVKKGEAHLEHEWREEEEDDIEEDDED